MAEILDGKALAQKVRQEIKEIIAADGALSARPPCLALILVGENEASARYVALKAKMAAKTGIKTREIPLPAAASESALIAIIEELNSDPAVDAILLQLPLPAHINTSKMLAAISPQKDVDGFHPYNVGLLHMGLPGVTPCTPRGIMALLAEYKLKVAGQRALVIGRSNIVGTPMAALLKRADATVTLAHSKSQKLRELIAEADIVVSAAGKAGLVQGAMLKKGAVIIDVGQNYAADGSLCGDVDFISAAEVASYITPVPGGVGPLTLAFLLKNTLELRLNYGQKE